MEKINQSKNEQTKKIFMIVTEESGATIGTLLMQKLKKEFNGNVEFYGIGDDKMCKEGLKRSYSSKELSYMGVVEIVRHVTKIVDIFANTEQNIRDIKPDVVIAIDSQDFALRLFQRIRDVKTIKCQYVAPSVWAWRQNRAKNLKGLVDYLFTLFPFENKFFEKHGIQTFCVGHNIIENDFLFPSDESHPNNSSRTNNSNDSNNSSHSNTSNHSEQEHVQEDQESQTSSKIITLLPGSRISEVRRHLPIIANTLKLLYKKFPNIRCYMPITDTTKKYIEGHMNTFKTIPKPTLVYDDQAKYELFKKSDLAIAASGTVALELGISQTPSIIIYKVNCLTAFIVKHMIKVPYVCLVNILMNKNIYPELLQQNASPKKIAEVATDLLCDKVKFDKMKDDLERFKNYMLSGNRDMSPTEKAAKIIAKAVFDKNSSTEEV